jgi:hypothetical protein
MLLRPDQLPSLPAPARRGLLLSKRDQKQADRKAVEVVTVVGDIVRPWLGRCARQPRVAESATSCSRQTSRSTKLGAQSISRNETSNSHAADASSSASCMVTVPLVDSRIVSPGRQ